MVPKGTSSRRRRRSWYRLALSHAYDVPKDGKLGQAYFDRNIPIVNERLRQAGAHLADTLNEVFMKRP